LLPEVDALYATGSRARRSKASPGARLSLALEHAAKRGFTLPVRYAVLAHDFNDSAALARRGAPRARAMRDLRRAEAMSARLKVPLECRDAARLAARWHRVVVRAPALQPAVLLGVINAADALRRPERLETLLHACECVVMSAPDAPDDFAPARYLLSALAVVKGVPAGAIARTAAPELPGSARADAIAKAIRSARLAALRAWKRTGA
jgi:tRNA nucleotidyltransferase (CCA-adding enzyme)